MNAAGRTGLRVVLLGVATSGVISACGAEPDSTPPEKPSDISQVAQPLTQTVETPKVAGAVTRLAGSGSPGMRDHVNARAGDLNDPTGVAVGGDGTVYIADMGNNSIRRVKLDGSLDTFVKGINNRLRNPGCEFRTDAQPLANWTGNGRERRRTQCPGGTCGFPYDGASYCWGGPGTSSTISQYADVRPYTSLFNAGTKTVQISGFLRTRGQETATVKVEYFTSNLTYISGWKTTAVSSANWIPFVDERVPPANTGDIRVSLIARVTSGGDANSYFDNLSVRPMPTRNAPPLEDAGLVGPKSLAMEGATLWVAANGIFKVSTTTGAVTKIPPNGAYIAPPRANSISVTLHGYVVVTDAVSNKLHVRSPSGVWYYAQLPVTGEALSAVGAPELGDKLFLWVAFRGQHQIKGFVCNKGTTTGVVINCAAAAPIPPYWPGALLGSTTAGYVDDLDGSMGSERFTYPSTLSQGLTFYSMHPDVFISEEGNHTVRRNFSDFTTTILGTGSAGWLTGELASPGGVAVAPDGSLVVTDRNNNRVEKIPCGGAAVCSQPSGGYYVPVNPGSACASHVVADDIACTFDVCEVVGIRHRPLNDGDSCNDGNFCNGHELCDAAGFCNPGTPLSVDDNQTCTVGECDPVRGVTQQILPAGTTCATGNPCAPFGQCSGVSGTCIAGPALDLDDLNPCTADACGATGVTHTPLAAGSACSGGTCDATGGCIPSNAVNPLAIDRTLPTPTHELWDDLLSPNGGTQTGSAACVKTASTPSCVFEPTHMALVRGVVKNAAGAALSGVKITVVSHDEYGSTQTLANGEFFIVVNGGGPLVIRANKTGFLKSDREVNPPWGGTEITPDMALIAVDPTVTPVALGAAGGAFASGSTTPTVAGDGAARQASVYFPSDVKAIADGVDVTSARFRVTEYTTGTNGKDRMPADVADNTMYTYASEFTLENAAGTVIYENVRFVKNEPVVPPALPQPKPVFAYLTNFIGLAEGNGVPVAYYNRQTGRWEPMDSGQVISVDAAGVITCGGPCVPAVTAEETLKLAVYKGKKVWRLPLTHFSPLDFNLGVGAPPCEGTGAAIVCPAPPSGEAIGGDDTPSGGSCKASGSIIEVERQVLRETFPVVGTPFSLNYSSENTLGYGWNKTLGIDLRNEPAHSKRKG